MSNVFTTPAVVRLFITNEVPPVILPTGADKPLAKVPDGVLYTTNIRLLVVTAVVEIVTVPLANVAVPALALLPVVIFILLPAVDNVKLPVSRFRFPELSKLTLSVKEGVVPVTIEDAKYIVVVGVPEETALGSIIQSN